MDMFRIPKYAASVYASQSEKEPYLEVLSSLNIGEQEASEIKEIFVMTNAERVKFFINDDFIDYFYPSKKYPHLPHPPIIIDDFIGNLIHENEEFNQKDCDRIKDVLSAAIRYGANLPLKYKIKMGVFLFKNKLKYIDAEALYMKYIVKWGTESTRYRFESYVGSKLVGTKTIGTNDEYDLFVKVDDEILQETDTYQTTRVVVEHLDKYLNPLTYSNEIITIKVKGPLELIGPSKLALIGGSIGFYLKTIQETGEAKITISSNSYSDKIFTIDIK